MLRNFRWNLNQWGTWNFGGDRLDLGGNINAHWVFTNNWSTGMGFNATRASFDDRATRGAGPGALRQPATWSYWGYVNSDDRKRGHRLHLLQRRRRRPRHALDAASALG